MRVAPPTFALVLALTASGVTAQQELPDTLPACAAHGLTMAIIYFRDGQIEGETEQRLLYEEAGDGLYQTSMALWAEETACAMSFDEADGQVSEIGGALLGRFDDAIENGANPGPLRGYFLAAWVNCVDTIGRETYAETVLEVTSNGLPCGWSAE